MTQPAPLYIVASPRPRVGKTLIAGLLIEFIRGTERLIEGYDLHPREPALAERFTEIVWPLDIADTRGQMELFDRLLFDNSITKVIDLGYERYEQFFAVMGEIDFVQEALRRGIEPIVLFVADPSPATAQSYAQLRRRLPTTTFVPAHNEFVSIMFAKEDFRPTHRECAVIRIPRLSPLVRGVIDRPSFSFGDYISSQPGGPTEVHHWIATIFAAFRELELRLMMGRLASSLGGVRTESGELRRVR
jgi:hypothetical protein